jgi:hypothetical protein
MTSRELLPNPETNTLPLPEAKWSKRPFTPSSGTVAVKISGGEASAAGGALAGAVVWVPWHAVNVMTSASKKPIPLSFFMLSPIRSEFNQRLDRQRPGGSCCETVRSVLWFAHLPLGTNPQNPRRQDLETNGMTTHGILISLCTAASIQTQGIIPLAKRPQSNFLNEGRVPRRGGASRESFQFTEVTASGV